MIFDELTHKVKPESLTKEQADVFILFLESEIKRHQEDIEETTKLVWRIKERFEL